MSIKSSGQFYTWEDAPLYPSLGIESCNLQKCILEINNKPYHGIFGCPVFGFKQDDLDFMHEIPHIRYIHFWEVNLKNIKALYTLKDLEYFSISPKRPAVNFEHFPKLKKVIWYHQKKDRGIDSLSSLKQLDLWRYKQPTYEGLQLPKTLEYLEINWSSPESLSGLSPLTSLKELQIHYCRNLQTLERLEEIAPNLEKLVITRCKNLTLPENFKNIPQLKHAWIQDKRVI